MIESHFCGNTCAFSICRRNSNRKYWKRKTTSCIFCWIQKRYFWEFKTFKVCKSKLAFSGNEMESSSLIRKCLRWREGILDKWFWMGKCIWDGRNSDDSKEKLTKRTALELQLLSDSRSEFSIRTNRTDEQIRVTQLQNCRVVEKWQKISKQANRY